MNGKKTLQMIRARDREIDLATERIMRLRSLAEKCTAHYGEGIGGGGETQDKRAEIVAQIVDLEAQQSKRIADRLQLERDAQAILDGIAHDGQREVLERRYLLRQTFEKIAEEMGYTLRNVYFMHKQALKKIR